MLARNHAGAGHLLVALPHPQLPPPLYQGASSSASYERSQPFLLILTYTAELETFTFERCISSRLLAQSIVSRFTIVKQETIVHCRATLVIPSQARFSRRGGGGVERGGDPWVALVPRLYPLLSL